MSEKKYAPWRLPDVVSSATVQIMGVDLVVHVLSDGQRVIEAESAKRFFDALYNGDVRLTEYDAIEVAKAIRGVK